MASMDPGEEERLLQLERLACVVWLRWVTRKVLFPWSCVRKDPLCSRISLRGCLRNLALAHKKMTTMPPAPPDTSPRYGPGRGVVRGMKAGCGRVLERGLLTCMRGSRESRVLL